MPPRRAADAQIGAEIDPRRPSLYEDAFLDQLLQVVKEALPPGEHGTNLPASSAGEDIGRMEASTHSTSSIWAAAGPLRSQESALHHISSMIARSINADDYWANLGHQVTVDHYAAFVNYCGTQGFSALKTLHLLKFLESFQALVAHGIVDGDADGTTKQGQRELSSHSTLAHPSSAAPSEDRKGDKKEKKEKKEKKKAGKKGKAATPATASPATEAAAPVEVPPASPLPALPPPVKRSLEEVLREKMRDFFTLEVEEGWKWDRFPRQPMEREVSPATTSKGKKASRSEKAKQQQQEQEEEQKRLAAAAALPPENIYLTTEEIPSFTLFFLARGLLQHTALYQYMASHEQADEPRCAFNFRVAPELPFPIRPLSEAVLQVAPEAAAAPAISEVPESKTALNRRISHHANAHRGNAQRGGAAAAAAAQQVPDPAPPPPPVEEKPAKDPLTLMREEQERELAQFSAEHKAAVELEEERARMAQTEKEMELLFENEGTQRAVVDVYGGMESQLTERQLRLLQRIEALEIALGLRPPPPEKPVEAEGQEDSRRRSPGRRKR